MGKTFLTLSLFLVFFTVNAQTCDDIQDIKHDSCHIASKADECKRCNYPQWQSMKSWYDEEVVEFTTKDHNEFLRFYSGNRMGSWMVKASDVCVDGKTASFEEIKEILQLTEVPNAIVIVDVPGGTVMYEGRIYGSTCGYCRQFCVKGNLDEDCFISFNGKSINCSF